MSRCRGVGTEKDYVTTAKRLLVFRTFTRDLSEAWARLVCTCPGGSVLVSDNLPQYRFLHSLSNCNCDGYDTLAIWLLWCYAWRFVIDHTIVIAAEMWRDDSPTKRSLWRPYNFLYPPLTRSSASAKFLSLSTKQSPGMKRGGWSRILCKKFLTCTDQRSKTENQNKDSFATRKFPCSRQKANIEPASRNAATTMAIPTQTSTNSCRFRTNQ